MTTRKILAIAAIGFAAGAFADLDAWDPDDDTASGATLLIVEATEETFITRTLSATDKYDFFKIQMTAGREYIFESTGTGDVYGELYSSTSTNSQYRVAYNDDGGDGKNFKLTYTATASQTYYLRVRTSPVGSDAGYSLRCSYTPDPDEWDPGDDTPMGATPLVTAFGTQWHSDHTLTATDKYDFFSFSMTAGRTYILKSLSSGDTYGELYSSTSTNSQYLVAYDDDNGVVGDFSIIYTPTVSQTYYLRVRSKDVGRNIVYSLMYWHTDPDEWDPDDDTPMGATPLIADEIGDVTPQHTLSEADRYDFFSISMTTGRVYVLESTGSSATYGELYRSTSINSPSSLIAKDDDSGEDNNFKITYAPTVSQTYYLRVRTTPLGEPAKYSIKYSYTFDPDEWDPGDDLGSGATLLTPTATVQTTARHTLSETDLYDFFRISMEAGRTYVLESTGPSAIYGELYSSTSTNSEYRVAYDDDGGDVYNFKLTYTPTVSKTYYLRVKKDILGTAGEYHIKYSYVGTMPTSVSAIFDAQGGKFSNGASKKTVEATPGNLWGKMPMPAMSGHVFDGWYTVASGGDIVTASSKVPAANTTYYAHWTRRLSLAAASEWSGDFTTDSWCGQGTVSHDGKDALRSGIVYDGQSSYLITKVTGPGTLTFWWAVSCEGGGKDALRLLVDGAQVAMISGEVDWTQVVVEIPGAGTHTIKWNYTKNGSVTKGEDFGWVDQISWAATPAESAFVFDANGGKFSNGASVKKTDATPGNLWGKMYMPAKDGQVFVGWYTAPEGGSLVTSSSVVPDYYTTYYAHWTPRLSLAAASEWSGAFETDSWCGQGAVSHDGKDALRSGIIYDNQSSYILTRVTGPGTFTFWWKVSSEGGGNDKMRFLVDAVQKSTITGENDWAKVTVDVTGSGTHIFKWVYSKNGSVTKGQDFAWLDQLSWTAK